MPTLVEAIDALIEANANLRKRREVAKLERAMQPRIARAFRQQSREFLSRFTRLRAQFPKENEAIREAVDPSELNAIFDDAALATLRAFADPIDEFSAKGIQSGMLSTAGELAVDISFDLKHPLAVEYLTDRGARQVSKINETTRTGLRVVLADAADNGWSYDKTAREIRRHYQHISRTRARNIAVFEIGDAYEAGNNVVAKDLQKMGLMMEKAWSNVGDHRVRPDHIANAAQGWIDIDELFQSGHDRPPTDPRCRCTTQYRRRSAPGGA